MPIHNEISDRIQAFIQTHRSQIVEDLKALVRIPSISCEGADGKPFGAACAKALELALTMAQGRGFETHNRDDWYGLAYYGNTEEPEGLIGIFSHLDVVEPGDNWIYAPFDPVEIDGYLIGRGANDNKSGAIIGLYALQVLKELKIPLRSNAMLYFGTGEEIGMADADLFTREEIMPDYSLVPDLLFPVCHGEKGQLKILIQSTRRLRQIRLLRSTTSDSMVPSHAYAELPYTEALWETMQSRSLDNSRIGPELQDNTIRIHAYGTGGHSAMPHGNINAIQLLLSFLSGLNIDSRDRQTCAYLAAFCGDNDGIGLGIDFTDDISGSMVSCPVSLNTDDGMAEILFSLRYPITDCRERIETELLRTISDKGFILKETLNSTPMYVEKGSAFVRRLTNIWFEVSGKQEEPFIIDGCTYARKLPNAVGFGSNVGKPCPFLPAGHGRIHGPDEAKSIQSLLEAIHVYALSILELDALIHEERIEAAKN